MEKEKEYQCQERNHLVVKKRNPLQRVKAKDKWVPGMVHRIPMRHVIALWEPGSPWLLSPSVPQSLNSASFNISAPFTLHSQWSFNCKFYSRSPKQERRIYYLIAGYFMELRVGSTARCCKRLEPKTIKVIQNWNVPSISCKQECFLSLLLCILSFSSSPLSLSLLLPPFLPRWALFVSTIMQPNLTSSFTSLLSSSAQWGFMSHWMAIPYF